MNSKTKQKKRKNNMCFPSFVVTGLCGENNCYFLTNTFLLVLHAFTRMSRVSIIHGWLFSRDSCVCGMIIPPTCIMRGHFQPQLESYVCILYGEAKFIYIILSSNHSHLIALPFDCSASKHVLLFKFRLLNYTVYSIT